MSNSIDEHARRVLEESLLGHSVSYRSAPQPVFSAEVLSRLHSRAFTTSDKPFILHDGRTLYSIDDLVHALVSFSDELFAHHVTSEKNDFASWVRDVFKHEELAEQISLASSPQELLCILRPEQEAFLPAKEIPKQESSHDIAYTSLLNTLREEVFVIRAVQESMRKELASLKKSLSLHDVSEKIRAVQESMRAEIASLQQTVSSQERTNSVWQIISAVQEAIDNGRWSEASAGYRFLREHFHQGRFAGDEEDAVHQAIHKLYLAISSHRSALPE